MKRALLIGGAALGVALVAWRVASKFGSFNWDEMLERMPDTAPPKWMFTNITAIRENTDRILERLESEPGRLGATSAA